MQIHPFLNMINISQQEIWTTQSRLRNGGAIASPPLKKPVDKYNVIYWAISAF